MDKGTLILISVALLIVVTFTSVTYWWNLNIETNIIHTATIQVSHTDCQRDPIFGWIRTTTEVYGGATYTFWDNQTRVLLAGRSYEISWRKTWRGFAYFWGAPQLLSVQELPDQQSK